jgi:ubiquinone/menaquinone biosynthesis C-methylase UbiE
MAHSSASAADVESHPDCVVECLGLKPDDRVAALGAGGGFYTVILAAEVGPMGKVYVVEIEQAYLDFVGRVLRDRGITNVELVLGAPETSGLPDGTLDLILVRNMFQDMVDRVAYLSRLRAALRPNGRVAVIEDAPGGSLDSARGHSAPEEEVLSTMVQAGYPEGGH